MNKHVLKIKEVLTEIAKKLGTYYDADSPITSIIVGDHLLNIVVVGEWLANDMKAMPEDTVSKLAMQSPATYALLTEMGFKRHDHGGYSDDSLNESFFKEYDDFKAMITVGKLELALDGGLLNLYNHITTQVAYDMGHNLHDGSMYATIDTWQSNYLHLEFFGDFTDRQALHIQHLHQFRFPLRAKIFTEDGKATALDEAMLRENYLCFAGDHDAARIFSKRFGRHRATLYLNQQDGAF